MTGAIAVTGAPTPAAERLGVDLTEVRYAQCWEDADVLCDALDVQPGDTCLSIASGGDNTLALLTRDPARVVAVDLSAAQLACVALRIAAYRRLDHEGLLELIGSRPSDRRPALYARCRPALPDAAAAFWDARPAAIAAGIGAAGRFERYFALFRRFVLPLVHSRRTVARLLAGGARDARVAFYAGAWDTWRWRACFRLFFSRLVMGRLGRDPRLFQFVEGSVADRILARARHALTELDPAANPYLQWILTGRHGAALPLALRPEHFETIRSRCDRVELRRAGLGAAGEALGRASVDRVNASDVFEYLAPAASDALFAQLADAGRPGGRLVYWNMLVPRERPPALAARLAPLPELATRLHATDRAFFYGRLAVEAFQ